MKVRNGFVSNSSSSSFCIVFPEEATYDGVRKLLNITDENLVNWIMGNLLGRYNEIKIDDKHYVYFGYIEDQWDKNFTEALHAIRNANYTIKLVS